MRAWQYLQHVVTLDSGGDSWLVHLEDGGRYEWDRCLDDWGHDGWELVGAVPFQPVSSSQAGAFVALLKRPSEQ